MALLPDNPANYDISHAYQTVNNLLGLLLGNAAWGAIIMMVYGAINYFLGAGGEKESRAAKGKTIIYWAIIGLIIILLSRVILRQIFAIIQPVDSPGLDIPASAGDRGLQDIIQ